MIIAVHRPHFALPPSVSQSVTPTVSILIVDSPCVCFVPCLGVSRRLLATPVLDTCCSHFMCCVCFAFETSNRSTLQRLVGTRLSLSLHHFHLTSNYTLAPPYLYPTRIPFVPSSHHPSPFYASASLLLPQHIRQQHYTPSFSLFNPRLPYSIYLPFLGRSKTLSRPFSRQVLHFQIFK